MTQMNSSMKPRQTDIHREQAVVAKEEDECGREGLGAWGWQMQTHIKGWTNKALLYSTGNYIQYPVINHSGKEYEK